MENTFPTYDNLSNNVLEQLNTEDICFPMVLSVPHSGTILPESLLNETILSEKELLSSCDFFVDELLQEASKQGIALIKNNIARVFIDVNRDKNEIDKSMFFNYPNQTDLVGGNRCRVGLGLIHRVAQQNKNIYKNLLDYNEIEKRVNGVYNPYHAALRNAVDKCVNKFGFCLLVDCHSMPSKICTILDEKKPVDVCLGTLFGESCPAEFVKKIKQDLEAFNYRVEQDRPYSGAFISFNFCQPRKNVYTLQLEINRALYMDEQNYTKNTHFQSVAGNVGKFIASLGDFLLDFKK